MWKLVLVGGLVLVLALTGAIDAVLDWMAPDDVQRLGRLVLAIAGGGVFAMYHMGRTIDRLAEQVRALQQRDAY